MKPLTPIGSPSPLRLLNKGPEYLRRQIDGGGHGRSISAVERLEADKAKYVKSQQVINTKQEPVLVPCATPPPQPRRGVSVPGSLTPHLPPRRSSTTPFSTLSGSVTSRDENDNEDSRKENRRTSVDIEAHNRSNVNHAMPPIPRTPGNNSLGLVAPHSAPVLRRSSGKRMLRPDSLVIYRQKKECKSPSGTTVGENNNMEVKGYSFVRRLFQGSMREKGSGGETRIQKMVISEEKASLREGDSRMSWTNDKDIIDGGPGSRRLNKTDQERIPGSLPSSGYSCTLERTKNGFPVDTKDGVNSGHINGNQSSNRQDENDPWKRASPQPAPRRKFVEFQRSKSDLRLRCSMAVSEQEHFFDFCGLDMDMIERLGRENFLSGASSIDTLSLALRSVGGDGCAGSEPSEFSRHSGDGLFEEELAEQLPTGVSIIERNARVIKWLYGCKNAVQEGPRESTV